MRDRERERFREGLADKQMMERDSKGKKSEHPEAKDGLDRVSHLPDPILSHIFSFLPTEDSVRTIFLSKNWKSLWSPLSVLDLDFKRFCENFKILRREDQKRRFTGFVERMIVLHQGRHLQELRLALSISPFGRTSSLIRKWVRFALTSNSTTLELKLTADDSFKFPACSSVTVRFVTVLKLTADDFLLRDIKSFESLNFESLQILTLTHVELTDNYLENLFSKCPMLEELHLIGCPVPSWLHFDAPNSKLKCLVLMDCYGSYDGIDSLSIKIPSLIKFKFDADMPKEVHVANLTNLNEVEIWLKGSIPDDNDDNDDNNFKVLTLLRGIRNVSTLSLCSLSLQLISLEIKSYNRGGSLKCPFNNLKHLELHTGLEFFELKGLACLLRSSPYLETLSLKLNKPLYKPKEFWNLQLVPFDCLHHLKKIELENFRGLGNEMEFAKFMLENALVLKEMVIYKATMEEESPRVYNEQRLKLLWAKQKQAIEKLLGVTRVSVDAQIVFV